MYEKANHNLQGAKTKKCEFRSTIATEKVWRLIIIEKGLLVDARLFVELKCGISFKIQGFFVTKFTGQHGNEAEIYIGL